MKRLINAALRKLGYRVVSLSGQSGFTAERIARLGSPATIIDVGAASGTWALYEAFPTARMLLVEPLAARYSDGLDEVKRRYDAVDVFEGAVGAEAGTVVMNVETEFLETSSLLPRTELTRRSSGTIQQSVPVERLDAIIAKGKYLPPFGLKIDTEGFELEVLRGCTNLLPDLQFVIAEVSVSKRFEGSYSFAEFVAYMHSIGFAVTDVLDIGRFDAVGTRYLDLVFRPAPGTQGESA